MDPSQRKRMACMIGMFFFVLITCFKMLMVVQSSRVVIDIPPPPVFDDDLLQGSPPWMNGVFMDLNMASSKKRKRVTGVWYVFLGTIHGLTGL
jgi:hypothetical protein